MSWFPAFTFMNPSISDEFNVLGPPRWMWLELLISGDAACGTCGPTPDLASKNCWCPTKTSHTSRYSTSHLLLKPNGFDGWGNTLIQGAMMESYLAASRWVPLGANKTAQPEPNLKYSSRTHVGENTFLASHHLTVNGLLHINRVHTACEPLVALLNSNHARATNPASFSEANSLVKIPDFGSTSMPVAVAGCLTPRKGQLSAAFGQGDSVVTQTSGHDCPSVWQLHELPLFLSELVPSQRIGFTISFLDGHLMVAKRFHPNISRSESCNEVLATKIRWPGNVSERFWSVVLWLCVCACYCSFETRFVSSASVVLALKWCTASNYLPLNLSAAFFLSSSSDSCLHWLFLAILYVFMPPRPIITLHMSTLFTVLLLLFSKASLTAHDILLLRHVFPPMFLHQTILYKPVRLH